MRASDVTRRAALEQRVIAAALDLVADSGADAFSLLVPHTTPPLYVALGDVDMLLQLLAPATEIDIADDEPAANVPLM